QKPGTTPSTTTKPTFSRSTPPPIDLTPSNTEDINMLYAIWDRLMYCLNIPAIQARSTPQGKAMSHDSSWRSPARWCGLLMLTAFLAACSSIPKDGLDIDTSLSAQERIAAYAILFCTIPLLIHRVR